MYAKGSDYNWNNNLHRQLIVLLISSVLILLLLLIPIRLQFDTLRQDTSLEVELSHAIKSKPKEVKSTPKIQLKSLPKTTIVVEPRVKKIKTVKSKLTKKDVPNISQSQATALPNSTVILNTYRKRKNYKELDQDFKMATGLEQGFEIKSIKPSKIYQVPKYLNEEIDKPQIAMSYKIDNNFVSTIKFLQRLTGGIYDNSEKKYIDCDLEVENIPDWQCQ